MVDFTPTRAVSNLASGSFFLGICEYLLLIFGVKFCREVFLVRKAEFVRFSLLPFFLLFELTMLGCLNHAFSSTEYYSTRTSTSTVQCTRTTSMHENLVCWFYLYLYILLVQVLACTEYVRTRMRYSYSYINLRMYCLLTKLVYSRLQHKLKYSPSVAYPGGGRGKLPPPETQKNYKGLGTAMS